MHSLWCVAVLYGYCVGLDTHSGSGGGVSRTCTLQRRAFPHRLLCIKPLPFLRADVVEFTSTPALSLAWVVPHVQCAFHTASCKALPAGPPAAAHYLPR